MKRIYTHLLAIFVVSIIVTACASGDKQVVILFTNDTHSQIDPLPYNDKKAPGMGGVERRKVLIDSLRNEYPHLLLVDAGDAVQGTPYFTIFAGEVENMAMNVMGYDVRTLGNHEFDNGMEALAANLSANYAVVVASNYDVDATILQPLVVSKVLCDAGEVKVGFIGLNVNPQGLIDEKRCAGVEYLEPLAVADSLALALRKDGADIVIALSHLGYDDGNNTGNPVDSVIIQHTHYIDMIIGGHSHTLLQEPQYYTNLDNRKVAVGQTGKSGAYLGYTRITIPDEKERNIQFDYKLLPVDNRYDDRTDPQFAQSVDRYRTAIDSMMSVVIGTSTQSMSNSKPESLLSNWTSDMLSDVAEERYGKPVDFAIMNMGGLRADFPQGNITRGNIFATFPFENYLSVLTLKGKDVRTLFETIARRGGEGVSCHVKLLVKDGMIETLSIGNRPIEDNRIYTIATIDYLANGGDQMESFKNALTRTDYPDPIRAIIEKYIAQLQAQNKCVEAAIEGRVVIKE